ncbi:MAG: hypothetical protein AUJ47_09625 [Candidatus Marinimicrobia bacterium CG1_02_48_14]|nr:MAG: hypothetical protein AUJ47_09625 [Candidatus Marinimicrobia bacterium CG1_02_48_14]PIZ68844.1 MAG: SET domain-containing protein-lysine N-methyltransferase [Candidatus Marinimicrobia bacterium CG_4_10_14_0_2_um_filter_48_9]PJA54705.1 MAG: SET domain-containing protein-lysine N-methyltransferase [Candidatus Marinimicrobia bacterium CG_4_9_14_3_um_filter_48_9]
MDLHPPKKIKICEIKDKGRGVISTENIAQGEIIETCPLIILGEQDSQFIGEKSDTLRHYHLYQQKFNRNCIMLGYASLYNHSFEPNSDIEYENDPKAKILIFRAIKDIGVGEEITWDYNFDNNIVEFMPANQNE